MKRVSILSFTLALILACPAVSRGAVPNIEVEAGGSREHKVIVFHDAEGKDAKRITLEGGAVSKNGKSIQRAVDALVSEDGSRVVTVEEERDTTEQNPYVNRFSSAVLVSLYGANGEKLCATQMRAVPKNISKDGRAITAIDQGLDPESLETFHEVPGLKSVGDLKGDTSLTDSFIYVLDDSCRVEYSTVSTKGGWKTEILSPSGRWLLIEENESGIFTPGEGWKYILTAIDVHGGRSWPLAIDAHRDIDPKRIADDGTVTGWKYLGESAALSPGEVTGTDGRKHKRHKSSVQYFVWKPGTLGFQAQGPEVEEDK